MFKEVKDRLIEAYNLNALLGYAAKLFLMDPLHSPAADSFDTVAQIVASFMSYSVLESMGENVYRSMNLDEIIDNHHLYKEGGQGEVYDNLFDYVKDLETLTDAQKIKIFEMVSDIECTVEKLEALLDEYVMISRESKTAQDVVSDLKNKQSSSNSGTMTL